MYSSVSVCPGSFLFTQWVIIHYYHYLFDVQIVSDLANRLPLEAGFCVLLTFPPFSEHSLPSGVTRYPKLILCSALALEPASSPRALVPINKE